MLSTTLSSLLALLLAAIMTPLVRRLALRMHVVDHPDSRRIHAQLVPRMGGLAILIGFFGAMAILLALHTDVAHLLTKRPQLLAGLAGGALLVSVLGAVDDVRGVSARTKLCVQTLAALIAYAAGFRIDALRLPYLGTLDLGILSLPATWLWICAVINAINLIDGLDGLAGGVAFFACLTNFIIAFMGGSYLICFLSASLGGAILGFLIYNFNPATIFMGDTGSMFLGYMLATISIFGAGASKGGTAIAIVVPLLALGLPIIDMLLAIVRRFVGRRSIFSADRGHIHHLLLDLGFTQRRAVLLLYTVCAVFALGALAVHFERSWQAGVVLFTLAVGIVATTRLLSQSHYALQRKRLVSRRWDADTEHVRIALPRHLTQLQQARRADDLFHVLADFGQTARLVSTALAVAGEDKPLWSWRSESVTPKQMSEVVRSEYRFTPTDGIERTLMFAWTAESGEVSPQTDILLQLICDSVASVFPVESNAATYPALPASPVVPVRATT